MSQPVTDSRASARMAAPSEPDAAVEVSQLTRRYGEREALVDVGLRLQAGETLVVFGPNGAGKTTLLRVLSTLLLPHAGDVRIFGHALPNDAQRVRPLVGMLGHDAVLYRDLSGRENLRFYARLYDVENGEQRIDELLSAVGIRHRADEPLHDLSRGMVQRLAICRAVLHGPRLLLLDEPHANLDPEAEQLVEPLIGASTDVARVLVTHDIERGLIEADSVLGLRDGRVAIDQPRAGTTTEQIRELYWGGER